MEAQPLHVFHDRLDVLRLFLRGIGIVETQVGMPAKLVRQPKIQADRLGMANVQIAVRLRRKARLHPPLKFIGLQIFQNDVADEV